LIPEKVRGKEILADGGLEKTGAMVPVTKAPVSWLSEVLKKPKYQVNNALYEINRAFQLSWIRFAPA
jgi:hypothetical protein